jgi:hypothetical protein
MPQKATPKVTLKNERCLCFWWILSAGGKGGYVDVLRQGDKAQDKGKAQGRKGFSSCLVYPLFIG